MDRLEEIKRDHMRETIQIKHAMCKISHFKWVSEYDVKKHENEGFIKWVELVDKHTNK